MKKTLLAIIAILLSTGAIAATSTINPGIPANGAPISSAPIRQNFQSAYNDINSIYTLLSQYTTNFQAGADTVIGNFGSVYGNTKPYSIPSCSDTAGYHLNYVSGSGLVCGSSVGSVSAANLTGTTLASGVTASSLTSFGLNPSIRNSLTITDSTGGIATLNIVATGDGNGANIKLQGDGGTTPNKYLKVSSGNFYITNSAYSSNILTLDDSGDLTIAGTLSTAGVISRGTKFTTTGCSVSATAGGAAAGTYTSGTAGTCTVVITINGATGTTAPNGWYCHATDLTTAADALLQKQTASSTTTATISGTTALGDVVAFSCTGY